MSGHDFALLDPQRKFVFNGMVLSEKKKAKLFAISKAPAVVGLFLFSDFFMLADPNPDKKTFVFNKRIELSDCDVAEEKRLGFKTEKRVYSTNLFGFSAPCVFKVFTNAAHDVFYLFTCKNEDEKKTWMEHFTVNIRENNRKVTRNWLRCLKCPVHWIC